MQKIAAFNQNNQPLEIEIIRYFKVNDKKYLIFTLNEKDEQGYINIYVSKILGLNGTLAAYDIIDATEWASIKELVKRIIKTNREGGTLEIEDLSLERLNNIKINGQQVFKLIGNLIELLGSNVNAKKDDEEDMLPPVSNEGPVSSEATSMTEAVTPKEEPVEIPVVANNSSSEYQKLYKELFDRYQLLIEENSKLKTQLDNIKAIVIGK